MGRRQAVRQAPDLVNDPDAGADIFLLQRNGWVPT